MHDVRSEQWGKHESLLIGGTIFACNIATAVLPFLIPQELPDLWPTITKTYDSLGIVFPYLTKSLPFSKSPEFYIVSKLVLFAVGMLCVLTVSFIPLTRKVTVNDHRVINEAKRPLWWFWLVFVIPAYWVIFHTYRTGQTLSWASRAAVEFPLGIAVGNFVQFGLFAIVAAYVVLIRHYLRLRQTWRHRHVR